MPSVEIYNYILTSDIRNYNFITLDISVIIYGTQQVAHNVNLKYDDKIVVSNIVSK